MLGEKIKLERSSEKLEIETKELESLEAERERVQKELDDCEQKDTVNKYELNELERTHGDLLASKEELQRQNDAMVLPELKRLEEELESLKVCMLVLSTSTATQVYARVDGSCHKPNNIATLPNPPHHT